jgi:hypothetical protein
LPPDIKAKKAMEASRPMESRLCSDASRAAQAKSLFAFIVDQILLFWPPYRVEHEDDPPDQQDGPAD